MTTTHALTAFRRASFDPRLAPGPQLPAVFVLEPGMGTTAAVVATSPSVIPAAARHDLRHTSQGRTASGSSLIAAVPWNRPSLRVARHTSPIPPLPSRATRVHGPNLRPVTSSTSPASTASASSASPSSVAYGEPLAAAVAGASSAAATTEGSSRCSSAAMSASVAATRATNAARCSAGSSSASSSSPETRGQDEARTLKGVLIAA